VAVKGVVEPHIEEADVYAFRALSLGQATADQQRRAMDWLGVEGCRLLQDPHTEVKAAGGDHDDVTFALGRRYPAILIREMQLPKTLDAAKKNTAARRPPESTKPPTLSQRRAARGKP
jgi:hypothetical protein